MNALLLLRIAILLAVAEIENPDNQKYDMRKAVTTICGSGPNIEHCFDAKEKNELRFNPFRGVARPKRQVELASELDAVVKSVLVEEGDNVEAGQMILILHDQVAEAAVAHAEVLAANDSAVQKAQTRLAFLEKTLKRKQILLKKSKIITLEEYEEAVAARDQAAAELAAAQAEKAQAERVLAVEKARLERHRIRAPFAGRIVKVHVQPGAGVQADESLVKLVALSRLEVELFVPVDRYKDLAAHETNEFKAGAPVNRKLTGRLVFVDPVVDYAADAVRCIYEIENKDDRLPAGFVVEMNLARPELLPEALDKDPAPKQKVDITRRKLGRPAAVKRRDRDFLE